MEFSNLTLNPIGTFAFGRPVLEVAQTDRSPKVVFVLGVYASAVHAQWMSSTGKTLIRALAVSSEPYIFWHGENADSIIETIKVPEGLGELVPASTMFNGPSGIALDNLILTPLGLVRKEVWLCDLVPHSCMNPAQREAIEREYLPIASKYGLAKHTVPPVPNTLTDENRRKAILDEIIESKSSVLILLGDKPIQWFLSFYDNHWNKLSDFGRNSLLYGQLHNVHVGDKDIKVLPLAHPRQIAKLGPHSPVWSIFHEEWLKQSASKVAQYLKAI